jgi:short subunit dehydrogenase-like uncharacterized protein
MRRVVVLGASGYTGRLAAQACVRRGLSPVLAGRDRAKLESLAARLGGGLEIQQADVHQPDSVRALVGPGDVLLTTVGPYLHLGDAALRAAVDAGAHYVDLCGEPPFLGRTFHEFGPRAEASGATLLPAFGHDWVPGNPAAALALREAGEAARAVEIGYFDYLRGRWFTGVPMSIFTSGTLATLASDAPPHSHTVTSGRLAHARLGQRVHSFQVDGRRMSAVSYGATEHLVLRRLAPQLTDVEVYLGWFGQASRLMSATIGVMAAASRLPGVGALQRRRFAKALQVTGEGPEDWPADGVCRTVAITRDEQGRQLSRVDVEGPGNGYQLTGDLMAWAADRLLGGYALRSGACGPVDAFGLDVVEKEFAELGLRRI